MQVLPTTLQQHGASILTSAPMVLCTRSTVLCRMSRPCAVTSSASGRAKKREAENPRHPYLHTHDFSGIWSDCTMIAAPGQSLQCLSGRICGLLCGKQCQSLLKSFFIVTAPQSLEESGELAWAEGRESQKERRAADSDSLCM